MELYRLVRCLEAGRTAGRRDGGSAIVALQFLYNAQFAVELFDALGEPDRAAHWRAVAERVGKAVGTLCWDSSRGLYADTPAKQTYSQHANILAILAGVCEPARCQSVMEKVLTDRTLTPCTLYFRFYLHRALEQAQLGERYCRQLTPWRDMLAIGLTTFAETPEPTRSDCHAWGACPDYDFLTLVCGIRPASAGFKTVRISPALGDLSWVAGRMPHPQGLIEVRLERRGEEGISADITLPKGLSGEFLWRGESDAPSVGKTTPGAMIRDLRSAAWPRRYTRHPVDEPAGWEDAERPLTRSAWSMIVGLPTPSLARR